MKPKVISPLIPEVFKMKKTLRKHKLHSVCEEAKCPNIAECFLKGTATFLIMGDICTRNCPYCNIEHGKPKPLDKNEPKNIAKAVKSLNLKYVVITSVNRDDLEDGGASHFAEVIKEIRNLNPNTQIEVLIPDFKYNWEALKIVVDAKPDVINHNIECVPSLYKSVRPRAIYEKSLELISKVKEFNSQIKTKSGIMVGLGEKKDEIFQTMKDLVDYNCDIFTIGQYLQPSLENLPVKKYYSDEEFKEFEEFGYQIGFKYVFSGKLVRSSYNASEVYKNFG
jgi:lipoic acid synthetase